MQNQDVQEKNIFISPEWYARYQSRKMESERGKLLIATCRSGNYLAHRTVDQYNNNLKTAGSEDQVLYLPDIDRQFSDSETNVRLQMHVSGYDVFLFQALYDPTSGRSVDENYMAFLIAARALREQGARHITGVLPYLAYGRQDKPTRYKREATTAKLMADLSINAGIDRMITWDPHSTQLHGFYASTPLNLLDPLILLTKSFKEYKGRDDVIAVAPDAGASKLVTHFGRQMKVNSAIASKYRPEQEVAVNQEIIGDFEGKKTAIILDDIISSGGTIYSVAERLIQKKGIEQIYLGISHNLCTDKAFEILVKLKKHFKLQRMFITNSIPPTEQFAKLDFIEVRCLADVLSRTINRIHYNHSVSEMFFEE